MKKQVLSMLLVSMGLIVSSGIFAATTKIFFDSSFINANRQMVPYAPKESTRGRGGVPKPSQPWYTVKLQTKREKTKKSLQFWMDYKDLNVFTVVPGHKEGLKENDVEFIPQILEMTPSGNGGRGKYVAKIEYTKTISEKPRSFDNDDKIAYSKAAPGYIDKDTQSRLKPIKAVSKQRLTGSTLYIKNSGCYAQLVIEGKIGRFEGQIAESTEKRDCGNQTYTVSVEYGEIKVMRTSK